MSLKSIELTPPVLAAADCVMILTDHPEFDYRQVVELARLVVDTRNATWRIPASQGKVVAL
jgi:UDP-N-acetyl-D-glucosamine dehydrogenase